MELSRFRLLAALSIVCARAFESLGQLAMGELMSNPQVSDSISGFERYADRAKIGAVLSPK